MAVTQKDVDEIKAAINKLTNSVNELITQSAVDQQDHASIRDHRKILYGDGENSGLIEDMRSIKKWRERIDKAIWYVLTPLLTAIGVGIAILISMGVRGGL